MEKEQTNLPSTSFKEYRRGNIVIANIAIANKNKLERNMKVLILDARMDEHGQLNEEDLKEPQNQGEKMVSGKTNKNLKATYKCYQNLWQDYVHKKISRMKWIMSV